MLEAALLSLGLVQQHHMAVYMPVAPQSKQRMLQAAALQPGMLQEHCRQLAHNPLVQMVILRLCQCSVELYIGIQ